jgi:hypothetical protein
MALTQMVYSDRHTPLADPHTHTLPMSILTRIDHRCQIRPRLMASTDAVADALT